MEIKSVYDAICNDLNKFICETYKRTGSYPKKIIVTNEEFEALKCSWVFEFTANGENPPHPTFMGIPLKIRKV